MNENNIKALMELERLVNESTSTTTLKPDLQRFGRIAQIINSKTTIPKEFSRLLKSKLASSKHPRTQMMVLEMIEFTTCKCGSALHNEFNSRQFLTSIHSIFAQPNLSEEVRDKALSLIQFWDEFFESRKDVFPNFSEYYANIQKRGGVTFPSRQKSPYDSIEGQQARSAQGQVSAPRAQVVQQIDPFYTQGFAQTEEVSAPVVSKPRAINPVDSFTPKQQKLFKDLKVVEENTNLLNDLVTSKELETAAQVKDTVEAMGGKLKSLPDKLTHANDEFLLRYVRALLTDVQTSLLRYQALKSRKFVPEYVSEVAKVLKPKEPEKVPSPPSKPANSYSGFEEPDQERPAKQPKKPQPQNGDLWDDLAPSASKVPKPKVAAPASVTIKPKPPVEEDLFDLNERPQVKPEPSPFDIDNMFGDPRKQGEVSHPKAPEPMEINFDSFSPAINADIDPFSSGPLPKSSGTLNPSDADYDPFEKLGDIDMSTGPISSQKNKNDEAKNADDEFMF